MVSDVDNHYFKRYGLLLAGSLLSGYGQAMARANTTVVTGPFGTTTTQGALSNKQVNAAALGKVGTTFSEDLLEQSKTKPTIHLDCNGGCPVGLLFMTDL
jgi:type IV secretory pathway VirB10-like protein